MTDSDQTYFKIRAALTVLKSDDLLCRHMERLASPHIGMPVEVDGAGLSLHVTVPSPGAFKQRNDELHAAGKAVALPLVKAALRTALEWKRKRQGIVYGLLVRALDQAHAMLQCDDYEFKHRLTAARHLSEAANLCATVFDARIRAAAPITIDLDQEQPASIDSADLASVMERVSERAPNAFLGEILKRTAAYVRAGKSPPEAIKAAMAEAPDAMKAAKRAEDDARAQLSKGKPPAPAFSVREQPIDATKPPAPALHREQPAPDLRNEIDAMLAEIARTQGFDAARRIVRRAGMRDIASIPDRMIDSLIRACEKALGREQSADHAEGPDHAEGA